MCWILIAVLLAGWVLLHLKTSRPDGTLVPRLHPYRRALNYIMPTRNESVVYFDEYVDAHDLLDYLGEAKDRLNANLTHALVGAFAVGFAENPRMNRFVVGRRVYQRDATWLTFSMKRKFKDKKSKVTAVKQKIEPGMTFAQLVQAINAKIEVERSDKETQTDKELGFFARLPRPVMRFAFGLVKVLDYYNLLPGFFIRAEGMYASMFIANLGSLEMGAGYHHLFELGTCPLFLMAGEIKEMPVVRDGQLAVRKQLHLRFTYEERIDDGLTARDGIRSSVRALERPYEYLGCLKADGSDARPFDKDGVAPY